MKIAIIGAGQAGRGFLGRLAYLSGAEISYIDRNADLLKALDQPDGYRIRFFGERREALQIRGYRVFHIDSEEAVEALVSADLIMTCVLAENLASLVPALMRARELAGTGRLAQILVCENGIDPSGVLRAALPEDTKIAEAVMLCTVCADGVDICSQDLDYLPYDAVHATLPEALHGFVPEYRFESLCRRKIYTYNCLSAYIAYLGAEKGYARFEEAANDPEIHAGLLRMRDLLDRVISRAFDVTLQEQAAFSQLAIDKFTNRELRDEIERNARNPMRKLGRNERIIAPMIFAYDQNEPVDMFAALLVSALRYAVRDGSIKPDEIMGEGADAFLRQHCGIEDVKLRAYLCSWIKRSMKL